MKVTFLIARQMKDKVFKTIAISIALLQILLSELVCKAVFGSYVLFETSGKIIEEAINEGRIKPFPRTTRTERIK